MAFPWIVWPDVWARVTLSQAKSPLVCVGQIARTLLRRNKQHSIVRVAFTALDKGEIFDRRGRACRPKTTRKADRFAKGIEDADIGKGGARLRHDGGALSAYSGAGRCLVCLVAQTRQPAFLRSEPAGDTPESGAGQTQRPDALERTSDSGQAL